MVRKQKDSRDGSGMRAAQKTSGVTKTHVIEAILTALRRFEPHIQVELSPSPTRALLRPAGNDYPGFDLRVSNPQTQRSFFLHVACQGDDGQAGYERQHMYYSTRKSMLKRMGNGCEYGVAVVPTETLNKAARYNELLAAAAQDCEADPYLGYLSSLDEIDLLEYAYNIAIFLGLSKPLITEERETYA
jgi:hypothetical protein